MCHEPLDDCLSTLKFIPDWFLTSKMIKKLFTAFYEDDYILYFNEDDLFSCNEMDIFSINLNNIILDDTNYNEDGHDTIIYIRLLAWPIKFEKRKALKKELNEELKSIVWHPKTWWNFCVSEDEKKEIKVFLLSNAFNVYNMEIVEHFDTKNDA